MPGYNVVRLQKSGFTLLELSIVLVIIGLIVGGVLVGKDLINTAEIKSVISQQEKIQTAVTTFRAKYYCLPGDCPQATALGFTDPYRTNCNGNGDEKVANTNGLVVDGWACADIGWERQMFWAHLAQALLISGYNSGWTAGTGQQYTGVPTRLRDTQFWAGYGAQTAWWPPAGASYPLGNLIALVGSSSRCAFFTCGGSSFSEALYTNEAQEIDTKIDDGLPFTGKVRATAGGNYIDNQPIMATSAPDNCVVGTGYASFLTNNQAHCNLNFKMSFGE